MAGWQDGEKKQHTHTQMTTHTLALVDAHISMHTKCTDMKAQKHEKKICGILGMGFL